MTRIDEDVRFSRHIVAYIESRPTDNPLKEGELEAMMVGFLASERIGKLRIGYLQHTLRGHARLDSDRRELYTRLVDILDCFGESDGEGSRDFYLPYSPPRDF